MGLIKKVDDVNAFKENLTEAELAKMVALDKELSPSRDMVKLGTE